MKASDMARAPSNSRRPESFLVKVLKDDTHVDILFDLLTKRGPSISHKHMPSYLRHRKFVHSHPYRAWYIIKSAEGYVGSIYLSTGNNVGINMIRGAEKHLPSALGRIFKKHKPLSAIPSVRNAEFDFNVAPSNKRLIAALRSMGATLVQVTYSIEGRRRKV